MVSRASRGNSILGRRSSTPVETSRESSADSIFGEHDRISGHDGSNQDECQEEEGEEVVENL